MERTDFDEVVNGAMGSGETISYDLKPEFKKKYNPNIQQFQPFDIESSKPLGEPIGLDALVERAFEQYNRRFNFLTLS